MIKVTNEENKSYEKQEACYICNEKFCMDQNDKIIKIEERLKITVIILGNLEELPIAFAIWDKKFQKIFQ